MTIVQIRFTTDESMKTTLDFIRDISPTGILNSRDNEEGIMLTIDNVTIMEVSEE
jgi:hypothetical protein